jgi:hypothetical protein
MVIAAHRRNESRRNLLTVLRESGCLKNSLALSNYQVIIKSRAVNLGFGEHDENTRNQARRN